MRRTLGGRRADGFALIDILFVCGIMGVLSCIALPRLLLARQSAGAASAIGSLRAVNSSQLTYALTCAGGFYAPDLMTLGTPSIGTTEGFISPNLATSNAVTKSGYLIQTSSTPYAGSPATCNGMGPGTNGQAFKAAADALEADNMRNFAINSNGQIWEHKTSLFATMPEAGEPAAGHLLGQ
jgi:type IV pilus assembly protein PilA